MTDSAASGVRPVRPPQPPVRFGPVDQLTMPITTRLPLSSRKAGAPESPVQAPSPALAPFGRRIKQADFERTRMAGDGERCRMHKPVEPFGAAHRHADAGDDERVADGDQFAVAGEPRRRDARPAPVRRA